MATEAEVLMPVDRAVVTENGKPPAAESGASEKPAMVLGIDDSEHSYYAMERTVHHFFAPGMPQQYHLIVVTAKPPASSVICIAGIGTVEMLPMVELDLKCNSAKVIDKAKELLELMGLAQPVLRIILNNF